MKHIPHFVWFPFPALVGNNRVYRGRGMLVITYQEIGLLLPCRWDHRSCGGWASDLRRVCDFPSHTDGGWDDVQILKTITIDLHLRVLYYFPRFNSGLLPRSSYPGYPDHQSRAPWSVQLTKEFHWFIWDHASFQFYDFKSWSDKSIFLSKGIFDNGI